MYCTCNSKSNKGKHYTRAKYCIKICTCTCITGQIPGHVQYMHVYTYVGHFNHTLCDIYCFLTVHRTLSFQKLGFRPSTFSWLVTNILDSWTTYTHCCQCSIVGRYWTVSAECGINGMLYKNWLVMNIITLSDKIKRNYKILRGGGEVEIHNPFAISVK